MGMTMAQTTSKKGRGIWGRGKGGRGRERGRERG
jgi:hypothetical protein